MKDGASSRSEEWKEGIKTTLFRRGKVRQMGVEDLEPKFWPVLPKVGHFAVIETPWSGNIRDRGTGLGRNRGGSNDGGGCS